MFVLRLTQKLGKKIHDTPDQEVPIADNPYADWTANLFRADRAQYIIISNTLSLYSVVIAGRGITDINWFIKSTISTLRDFVPDDGNAIIYNEYIAPEMGRMRFAKTRNRRVLGSLNTLVQDAQFFLTEKELSPFQTAHLLNQTPLSFLEYDYPAKAFRKLVEKAEKSKESSAEE